MTTATAKQPAPQPRQSRMSLSSLVKGKIEHPLRVLLFGVEGVGKSTFAAGTPSPIFLTAEDGTAQLDVVRFQPPESWGEAVEAVRTLTVDKHDFKTLVIDTLDWAEPLLWDFICKRDKQANIESYGYGKGYSAALEEWRNFVAALEEMRRATKMHVVMLAHSQIKAFKNPEGEDFDRYELKLNKQAAGLLKEWSDCVLFANHETVAHKDAKTKRVRGIDTGARLIHTQRSGGFDAKNRYDLPPTLPLSWPDFEEAVKAHAPADPDTLIAAIQEKAKLVGGKEEKHALTSLKTVGKDAARLAKLNDWLNSFLNQKEQ